LKPTIYPLLFSAVLSLTACGGGDSNTRSITQPPPEQSDGGQTPPPPSSSAHVIEYYGDSTIWGYLSGSTGERVETPAPQAFADALPASNGHEVRNEGVNSSTACGLLNGSDGVHPEWDVQMASSDASHVIINHGINDQWEYGVSAYRSCLTSLAETAKARGKQVIFETPNPIEGGDLAPFVSAMREVAAQQQIPVIDQHQYLMDYLGGQSVSTICPDGVHPSASVYVMKGEFAASEFAAVFSD
jgi:lysophospholipase L1-like esterase